MIPNSLYKINIIICKIEKLISLITQNLIDKEEQIKRKNEIKLNVTENSLEISGEHKEESEEKKKNYLTKERSQISYYRTLPLSENVVASKVKAKLSDGVLDITLPKSKPTKTQKKKSVSVQ